MSMFRPRRPSPALVVSVIALVVALGGTSYAAFSLPKNSVGTKQLKNGAVTTSKLKNGAVTASKLNVNNVTVPNSLHAGSANTAGSATNANHASSADNATNAGNANTVGGKQVLQFAVNDPTGTTNHTVLSVDGIVFQAGCDGSNDPELTVQNNSGVAAALDGFDNTPSKISVDPFGTTAVSLTAGLNGGNTATVTRVDGVVVSVTFGASGLSLNHCRVSGSVIAS